MPNLDPGEELTGPNSLPEHPTAQQLLQPLVVHFRRFVAEQIAPIQEQPTTQEVSETKESTVWNRLSNTPDFLLESGHVNPAWVEVVRPIHHRVYNTPKGKRDTPGKLTFSKAEGWKAADPNSPVGQIARLQQQAGKAQATNAASIKAVEKVIRQELVDIFNAYAGKRFNGVREVVDGRDFNGITLNNIAYRSLKVWRAKLIRTRYQSIIPELFDRWEDAPKGLKTPTRADQFLTSLFREFRQDSNSSSVAHIAGLVALPNAKGYLAMADVFYGGDMLKTFKNFSAIAKITGQTLPKGWQQFHGSTTEFRALQSRISTLAPGIEGYLSAADELYRGDMLKTSQNLSAVANMTEQKLPKGWQAFQGSTAEFRSLQTKIETFTGGVREYMATADELYGGDMYKMYLNLSAIANMRGQALPKGWQGFQGSTAEFRALQSRISTFTGGVGGYVSAADELYRGNMRKTYINLSAVANMTRQPLPEGWQAFHGTTTEFRLLQSRISTFTSGVEGYLSAADELYDGDMLKTYLNLSAVANMTGQTLPNGWQQFQGSTAEFKKQQQWLKSNPQATIDMFMGCLGTKNRQKANLNLAAIRNMKV